MFASATKEEKEERSAAENIRANAARIKNDANNAAHTIKEDLNDLAHDAGRHVREMAGNVEESFICKIRDNPVQSSLIALGAGVMLGILIRR